MNFSPAANKAVPTNLIMVFSVSANNCHPLFVCPKPQHERWAVLSTSSAKSALMAPRWRVTRCRHPRSGLAAGLAYQRANAARGAHLPCASGLIVC